MPKSDNQKLKILYILDYLQKNSHQDHPVRTSELLSMLEEHDIVCDRKTVYSDIAALLDYGVDILSIPGKNGNDGNMEVSVSKDGGQDTVHEYRYGSRAKVTGTLLLKRRGEKLYFNLSADSVDLSDAGNTDSVKGPMVFRGKTGKHIEERKDKTGKPYLMFSAFSTEKVNDGFEYQWVRFFCFGKEKEEWLQPGVKVDVKGEMYLSLYDGKPDISCRVEELNQYVPEAGNDNR